jgi:glycosyltransferase involved in cell wall biosynthesis
LCYGLQPIFTCTKTSNLKTILFFRPSYSTIIKQDELFLKKKYDLKNFIFDSSSFYRFLNSSIKQTLFLYRNIRKSTIIYVCHADFHAFLPMILAALFKKKSILIVGGFDAVKSIEFKYGAHINSVRSWVIKICCKLASRILPVSSFVLKNLVQNIKSAHAYKTKIVYNGADTKEYCFDYSVEKRGLVFVSQADSVRSLRIEGLDFYAEAAKRFPTETFKIVGATGQAKKFLENLNISNIQLVEQSKREELKGILNQSEVICQFSRLEEFGLTLTEGMLCGCIPVSLRNTAPEEIVTKDVGVLIENLNVDEVDMALKQALSMPWDIRNRARLRVVKNFSLKEREQSILKLLDEIQVN